MEKYLVVTDTTSAMDAAKAKIYGVELLSLSVLIDRKEYKDQVDITTEEFYQKLKDGTIPSTSQPSTGYIEEKMRMWKQENYEAIIIITCSNDLSGTWSGINLVKNTLEMDNVHIVDSRSIGAPIMDMAIDAKIMADQGKCVEEIIDGIQKKSKNTFSFLLPDNFIQLKRSGRLSPLAATAAALIKLKVLLCLNDDATMVEKYLVTRTETKVLKAIVEKFEDLKIQAQQYKIYLSHANNLDGATKIKGILEEKFNNIECEILALPAVLTCHGGLGCVAVQTTYKL